MISAIITKQRYGFAAPEYRVLALGAAESVTFLTAQQAADYCAVAFAGQVVEWRVK